MKNPELVALLKTKYPEKTEDDLSSKAQDIIAGSGSEMTMGHDETDVYLQCSRCQAKYIIQQDWDIDDNNELFFCVNEHCYLSQFIPPNFVINEIYNYDKNTFNTERADTGFVSLTCNNCNQKSVVSIPHVFTNCSCSNCFAQKSGCSYTITEDNEMDRYVEVTCKVCKGTYRVSRYAFDCIGDEWCPLCNKTDFFKIMFYTSTQKCFWIDDKHNLDFLTKFNIQFFPNYEVNIIDIFYTHIEDEESYELLLFVYEDHGTVQYQLLSYSLEQFSRKELVPTDYIIMSYEQYSELFKAINNSETQIINSISSLPVPAQISFDNYVSVFQQLLLRNNHINNVAPQTYMTNFYFHLLKRSTVRRTSYLHSYIRRNLCDTCGMILHRNEDKCFCCNRKKIINQ